jgi:Flp pilus assembly protein TadD
VIEARSRTLGRGDAGTLVALNNLGTCLARAGRFAEACDVHSEVLAGRRVLLGARNPHTLSSANNLAFALFRAGGLEEALELQEEVVAGTPGDAPQLEGRRRLLADLRRAAGR